MPSRGYVSERLHATDCPRPLYVALPLPAVAVRALGVIVNEPLTLVTE
jgi:hypothetical protein